MPLRLLPLLLLLCLSTSVATAAPKRSFYIAGGSLLAIPTGVDSLLWGVTNKRDHAWSWHLVPIVGPIKGIAELLDRDCEDTRHGCPGEKALMVGTGLSLAAQTAGLIVITIGLLKDSPEESSAMSLAPFPLLVSPSKDGVMVNTGFSF